MREAVDSLSPTTVSFIVLIKEYAEFSADISLSSSSTAFIVGRLLKVASGDWEALSFDQFMRSLHEETGDETLCEKYATRVIIG